MRKLNILIASLVMAQLLVGCSSEEEKAVETLAPKYSEKEVFHPSGNTVNPPDPNSKIVKIDHLAIFLDERNWKKTTTTTGTLFSLNNKPATSAVEVVGAYLKKGEPFSTPQKEAVDQYLSQYLPTLGSTASTIEWKEISSDEEGFLANFQAGTHSGYIRIFGNTDEYAILIYRSSKPLNPEDEYTWKDLFKQSNLEKKLSEG